MMFIYFILSISMIGYSSGADCDAPPDPMVSFQEADFTGTWSVVLRSERYDDESRCDQRIYSGPMTDVSYKYKNPTDIEYANGTFTHDGASGDSDYDLLLKGLTFDYVVVNTDYDTYAVIYKCLPIPGGHKDYIEVLTKKDPVANYDEVIALAGPEISTAGYDSTNYDKVDHSNCNPSTLSGKLDQLKAKLGMSGADNPLSGLKEMLNLGGSGDPLAALKEKLNMGGGTNPLSGLKESLNLGGSGDPMAALKEKLNMGGGTNPLSGLKDMLNMGSGSNPLSGIKDMLNMGSGSNPLSGIKDSLNMGGGTDPMAKLSNTARAAFPNIFRRNFNRRHRRSDDN